MASPYHLPDLLTNLHTSLSHNPRYWNFSGFSAVSSFAGEVDNPTRTYPRGLALAVPLVAVAYLLPLAAAVGTSTATAGPIGAWSDWTDGSFVDIASGDFGGPWLVGLCLISAASGNIGTYTSEVGVWDSHSCQQ